MTPNSSAIRQSVRDACLEARQPVSSPIVGPLLHAEVGCDMGEWNAATLGLQQDEDQLGLGGQAVEGRYFVGMLVDAQLQVKGRAGLFAQFGLGLERANVIIERADCVQRDLILACQPVQRVFVRPIVEAADPPRLAVIGKRSRLCPGSGSPAASMAVADGGAAANAP